jgi:hypothetical protein
VEPKSKFLFTYLIAYTVVAFLVFVASSDGRAQTSRPMCKLSEAITLAEGVSLRLVPGSQRSTAAFSSVPIKGTRLLLDILHTFDSPDADAIEVVEFCLTAKCLAAPPDAALFLIAGDKPIAPRAFLAYGSGTEKERLHDRLTPTPAGTGMGFLMGTVHQGDVTSILFDVPSEHATSRWILVLVIRQGEHSVKCQVEVHG